MDATINEPRVDLAEAYEQIAKVWRAASAESFIDFAFSCTIDSRPEPALFGEPGRGVARDWQYKILAAIAPALESISGLIKYNGPRGFWFTLPRGSDKTTLAGRAINWLLAFSSRNLRVVAAAGDRDQARLMRDAMEREADLNPWFRPLLKISKYHAKGPGGELDIISADASSAYGHLADVIFVDELTHWPKRDLFDALWTGRQKRDDSIFIVITNAGEQKSWQWDVLQLARKSDKWWVFEADEYFAPGWQREDEIAEDRKVIPPSLARRLFDSIWTLPGEESEYLTRAELERCEDLAESLGIVAEADEGEKGIPYVAAIDYGARVDRCVLCVLHREWFHRLARRRALQDLTDEERELVTAMDPKRKPWRIEHEKLLELSRRYRANGDKQRARAAARFLGASWRIIRGRPDELVVVIDRMDVWEALPGEEVPIKDVENWIEETARRFRRPMFVIDPYQLLGSKQTFEKKYNVVEFEFESGKKNYEMAKCLRGLVIARRLLWPRTLGTLKLPSGEVETFTDEVASLVVKPMSYGYRFDHQVNEHDDRAVAVGMGALHVLDAPAPSKRSPMYV